MEKAMFPSLRFVMGISALIAASVPTAAPFAAQDAVVPPKMTWDCECPMSKLADPAALLHFAAAIKQKNTVEVVAIGSSSTLGIGASTLDRTYPFQLQGILERTFDSQDFFISNSGIGGEVAAQTAKRVVNEVALKLPDLLLWQVGTNDVLAGVPVDEFKATVQSTLRWLKYHGIDTVLIGLQYSPAVENSARHQAVSRAISEVAAEENVLLVRRYDAMRYVALTKANGLLSDDGLHQNDLGYRCMAEHVAHAVIASAFPPALSTAPKGEEARRMQP